MNYKKACQSRTDKYQCTSNKVSDRVAIYAKWVSILASEGSIVFDESEGSVMVRTNAKMKLSRKDINDNFLPFAWAVVTEVSLTHP